MTDNNDIDIKHHCPILIHIPRF